MLSCTDARVQGRTLYGADEKPDGGPGMFCGTEAPPSWLALAPVRALMATVRGQEPSSTL
jgi:hypothetical protein